MNILLGIALVVVNAIVLNRNSDKGIELFVILSLVAPVSKLGSTSIYYNYLFLPVLLWWAFKNRYFNVRVVDKAGFWLFVYWLVVLVSTVLSVLAGVSNKVNIFSIIGTLRYILIFLILCKEQVIKDRFNEIMSIVLIINLVAMMIEWVLLQIYSYDTVIKIWLKLYATSGSSGSLSSQLNFGAVGRLNGTFSSSAFISTLSVIGLAFFVTEYRIKRSSKDIFMLVVSLFCGIASSSKRFFLGGILVVVLSYLYGLVFNKELKERIRGNDWKFPLVIIVLLSFFLIFYNFFRDYLAVDYYMKYLLEGKFAKSFSSRFGESGVVNSMKDNIKNNLIIGVGEVFIPNVDVTDSSFYTTLYFSGIIGLITIVLFFLELMKRVVREKSLYKALILSVMMFEFIISTEFFSHLGILMLAYVGTNTMYTRKNTVK